MEDESRKSDKINLLQGEQEVKKLGKETYNLRLTNKRVIEFYREARTSYAMIAFLRDIVTAKVDHTGRNGLILFLSIISALGGIGWYVYSDIERSYNDSSAAGILTGGLVFGIVLFVVYWFSSNAVIIIKTANDELVYKLDRLSSSKAFQFINKLSEMKEEDYAGRG